MRVMSLIVLAAAMQMQPVWACSFDDLKKVADERLEYLRPNSGQAFPEETGNTTDGHWDTWQVFEGEQGTPHTLVVTGGNLYALEVVRVSFVNRHDYAVLTSHSMDGERFDEEITQGKRYLFGGRSVTYYCGDKLQVPPQGTVPPVGTKFDTDGDSSRDDIFNHDALKPQIARVPE